jgi:1L-myo-inositol 1-phosphate cytidylyltransferase / CDP-L-myo-inositol myo-inositolphosphotransferase
MQFEHSNVASSGAPSLVLLPSVACAATGEEIDDGEQRILGLSLAQRSALAAHRAGYDRVFFLARDRPVPPGAMAISNWRALADVPACRAAPLVIAPACILPETDWLKGLAAMRIKPAAWAAVPNCVAVLDATVVPDAVALLDADGGSLEIFAVEERLDRRFGPAAEAPSQIRPMIVTKREHIPLAERRLMRGLVKDTDGFMARNFDRHISLQISRRLAHTNVKPTQVTMLSLAIGLCGAPFFLSAHWSWQIVGALLFLLHSIIDGCDGELARLKFQESRTGGVVDFWGDNAVLFAVLGCIAIGWALSSAATIPLWLGAVAIVSTLASASLVYWKQLRAKDGIGPFFTSVSAIPGNRLSRILDGASRRDFIYAVPILAVFGKASWLLILAAVGGPTFLILLLVLIARERSQIRPTQSVA